MYTYSCVHSRMYFDSVMATKRHLPTFSRYLLRIRDFTAAAIVIIIILFTTRVGCAHNAAVRSVRNVPKTEDDARDDVRSSTIC